MRPRDRLYATIKANVNVVTTTRVQGYVLARSLSVRGHLSRARWMGPP
jgi:hypothetical protein